MTNTDSTIGEPVITVQPATPTSSGSQNQLTVNNLTTGGSDPPKRKVSIITDPIAENRLGHDNLAFEQNPRRKTSQQSEHSECGPVRRKSILHNSGHDNESVHSHHSYNGKNFQSKNIIEANF